MPSVLCTLLFCLLGDSETLYKLLTMSTLLVSKRIPLGGGTSARAIIPRCGGVPLGRAGIYVQPLLPLAPPYRLITELLDNILFIDKIKPKYIIIKCHLIAAIHSNLLVIKHSRPHIFADLFPQYYMF